MFEDMRETLRWEKPALRSSSVASAVPLGCTMRADDPSITPFIHSPLYRKVFEWQQESNPS
jgi:hypothetical protein